MELGLEGKAALVTAASKGSGAARRCALAREGATCRSARATEARLAGHRRRALPARPRRGIPADVTEPDAPARLVDETVERFGPLDILVANAGGPPPARALDVDDDGSRPRSTRTCRPRSASPWPRCPTMRAAGWGRICFITSNAVKQPIPDARLFERRPHGPVGLGQDRRART